MLIEVRKQGKARDWRWRVRCESCLAERWLTPGAGAEKRLEHPCRSCRSKKNWANPDSVEKRKRTCLQRYGSINSFQSEQTKRTVREHYGVDNVFQAEVVKQAIIESTVANHGCRHSMQSPEIQAKSRATMMKNHGVEYALQSPTIKAKIDFHAAWEKRHERAKRLNRYGTRTSQIEQLFHHYNSSLQ